jgi:D-beta-D-heptose 7-phosphate kinase/D-beta-D-heptose 1-phosphate adenosyltransferase
MNELRGKSPKILVIGDIIIDKYLWGDTQRVSPEAPVQVVSVKNKSLILGGAGNVANNLKALGAKVDIISVIGDCKNAENLKNLLFDINISTRFLYVQKNRISSVKTRIVSSNQQIIRYDYESDEAIKSATQEKILNTLKKIISDYKIILLSDYSKGVLTKNLTQSIIKIAKKNNVKVLIDPKSSDYSKYKGAFLLTPNKKEASEATSIEIHNESSLIKAIKKLKSEYLLNISIITLSENGIAAYDDKLSIYPTISQEVFDVTGAGDTVIASIGFALACGLNINSAIKFSNVAAGVVVKKFGSSTATIDEIISYESNINNSQSKFKIKSKNEIIKIVEELKSKNKKIIFTNGCFDILHSGHVEYLESAKKFGDILIVGLNSDKSVSYLKGRKRPINPQKERAILLAAMKVIDFVVIFNEDTPLNLIKVIKPHILVKGGDYKGKKIIGQELVNETKLVPFLEGRSTTSIIKKIQEKK